MPVKCSIRFCSYQTCPTETIVQQQAVQTIIFTLTVQEVSMLDWLICLSKGTHSYDHNYEQNVIL